MGTRLQPVRDIELQPGRPVCLPALAGRTLRVLAGTVWLTEEGQRQDVFLAAMAERPLAPAGRIVIEGVGPARVAIYSDRRGARATAVTMAAAVARIALATNRLRVRSHFGEGAAMPTS